MHVADVDLLWNFVVDVNLSWNFVHNFTMNTMLSVFEKKGPTILQLLIVAATNEKDHIKPQIPLTSQASMESQSQTDSGPIPLYTWNFSTPPLSGRGKNCRDPLVVSLSNRFETI